MVRKTMYFFFPEGQSDIMESRIIGLRVIESEGDEMNTCDLSFHYKI